MPAASEDVDTSPPLGVLRGTAGTGAERFDSVALARDAVLASNRESRGGTC